MEGLPASNGSSDTLISPGYMRWNVTPEYHRSAAAASKKADTAAFDAA